MQNCKCSCFPNLCATGLSSLQMDGCLVVLKHAAPHLLGYTKFGHLAKPYERNFGYPLRSRLSKSLKVSDIDTGRSSTYSGGNSGTNIMQMYTKMHDLLCKISNFPGDDIHGTPSRTYPHIGDAPLGQDADHLLVTPMLNTNRPHAVNHWCVVPPSASEHFRLLAVSSGTLYCSR